MTSILHKQYGLTMTNGEHRYFTARIAASLTSVQRIAGSAVADFAFYQTQAREIRCQIARTDFGDATRGRLLRIARTYDKLARLAESFIRRCGA